MSPLAIVGLGLAAAVGILAIAFAINRFRRNYGSADSIAQLIAATNGEAIFTVEIQHTSGRGGGLRDGRLIRRGLSDGKVLARMDVSEHFVVLGFAANGALICSDPTMPVHLRNATTLLVEPGLANAPASLAPFATLDPKVVDGELTMADNNARRASMTAVIGAVTTPAADATPHSGATVEINGKQYRLVGAPRARLECRGKSFGNDDFLGASLFSVGIENGVLLMVEADLATRSACIVALDDTGAVRFSTNVERRTQDLYRAVILDQTCVLCFRAGNGAAMELIALEPARLGAVRWRTRL